MKQETPKQHVELINDNIEEFDKALELFKQESTLEEAAEKASLLEFPIKEWYYYRKEITAARDGFKRGAKWQMERSYSDEDMLESFMAGIKCESKYGKNFEQFIKQFKKK